jgi:protein-tyrosine phosphatase
VALFVHSVFWLIDDQLAGRPGPTKEPWSVQDLRRAGFDAILNLSEHPPEQHELDQAGLSSFWIPLPTTVPPDLEAERTCLELLPRAHELLKQQIALNRRVLVHCVAGCDRTGMVLAYHLVRSRGLGVREAIRRVREARPPTLSAAGWEDMAVRVMTQLLAAA